VGEGARSVSSELELSTAPPPGWEAWAEGGRLLFQAPAWQRVLTAAFAARPVYCWHLARQQGAVVTLFRRGPFRVAYLGFPVISEHVDRAWIEAVVAALRAPRSPIRVDLVRVPASAFVVEERLAMAAALTPETAIENLSAWSPHANPKLERDLRKARHSRLEVDARPGTAAAASLYALYRETIRRRGGRLRYNLAYFRELLALSGESPRLRCFVARLDGAIVGFAAAALDGATACYLHAATDTHHRHLGVSDRLLEEIVEWALESGAVRCNLMSSPPASQSLVRFKEKWGGSTRLMPTYWTAFDLRGRLLARLLA